MAKTATAKRKYDEPEEDYCVCRTGSTQHTGRLVVVGKPFHGGELTAYACEAHRQHYLDGDWYVVDENPGTQPAEEKKKEPEREERCIMTIYDILSAEREL